jgi:two-component system response regulator FixJ
MNPVVHVIDDDPGMRKSIAMLMESASLVTKVYSSAEEFLIEVDLCQSGCIVLDLRMPGMGGTAMLQWMADKPREMPVIVISGHVDVPAAVRSMKLGAVDVLRKPFEPAELLEAVRRAMQESVALHERNGQDGEIRNRFATLSPRELQLLKMIVNGKPNKVIAQELSISVKTVANHRASLMAKTQAANGPDLVRMSSIAGIEQI